DSADDRAEGYRLLTEAYLRLPEPNLKAAIEVNEKLRLVPKLPPEAQAQAQLQGGELLVRLHRAEDARKVVKNISTQAPPRVLSQARVLRAQSFQTENRFSEASDEWKKLLSDTREPLPNRSLVLYFLGVCEAKDGKQQDAAR